jgi:hypothetical protein
MYLPQEIIKKMMMMKEQEYGEQKKNHQAY